MNRRGFFAALVAAPLAAVAGLRPVPRFDRIWKMIDSYGKSPMQLVHESTLKMVDEMSAISPDMGVYMPKTKPFIDEQWRRYAEALRKDT